MSEVAADERRLERQRNARLRAGAQALAEELGQLEAHAARALRDRSAISALIECRQLNRKCGSTCARSARSSASRAATSACSARATAARAFVGGRQRVVDRGHDDERHGARDERQWRETRKEGVRRRRDRRHQPQPHASCAQPQPAVATSVDMMMVMRSCAVDAESAVKR